MEAARQELNGVTIVEVTSPEKIAEIAEQKGLNPQEVFVRVTFEIKNEKNETKKYTASNKLRFFGLVGYEKLLKAKASKEPTDIVLSQSAETRDIFMYLPHEKVEISSLFAVPVTTKDDRDDLADLF